MAGLLKRMNYLVSNGLLFKELRAHLKHKTEAREKKLLPQIDISAIVGEAVSNYQLLEEDAVDGNVTLNELKAIAMITATCQPKRIFEIGTFDGRTTINLSANAPNAEVITLDLPAEKLHETKLRIKSGDRKFINKPRSGSRFKGTIHEQRITQIYADSASFDSTPFESSIDLVFIDGSHSYEYVKSDTELALRLLRSGKGTILWHDYGWHEVVKALNMYQKNHPLFTNLVNIKGTTLAHLYIS